MSFLDRLRSMLSGPARVQAEGDEEAALREEYGAGDAGESDLKRMEETGGGGGGSSLRYGASEAAEAAEADLETEEAPHDPDS